jgi:autotransporter-associated beta strand protein
LLIFEEIGCDPGSLFPHEPRKTGPPGKQGAIAMKIVNCFTLILILGLIALPSEAATRRWIAGNGFWSNPNNWRDDPDSLPGVPQDGDTLIFANAEFESFNLVRTTNDLVNLTVGSLQFGKDDLEEEAYRVEGNPLTLLNELRVFAPETTADIFLSVITANGATFNAVAPMGLNYPAQLWLKGSLTLNGRLILRTHYAGEIDLRGPIVGAGDLVLPHYTRPPEGNIALPVKISGTADNTFTGSIVLEDDRMLELEKTTGVAVPVPLFIHTNCAVNLNKPNQIADDVKVVVTASGQLKLQGNHETIGNLCITNYSTDSQPVLIATGSGATLSVLGDIAVEDYSTAVVPYIIGSLGLTPGNHVIRVGSAGTYGLDIQAQIVGDGGFTKTGPGGLVLKGSSTFFGDDLVQEGRLDVNHANALGSPSGATILDGGTLYLNNVAVGIETLWVNRTSPNASSIGGVVVAASVASWAGPVAVNTNLVINGGSMTFSGPISGPAGLHIANAGTHLEGSEANTFQGTTYVFGPLLELSKPAGVRALGSKLEVHAGGNGNLGEVRWQQDYQAVGLEVTLYTDAWVNLNNHRDDFGPITFNSGQISTGTGELGVYGLVKVNFANTEATINGRLGLPAGPREFRINNGTPLVDLAMNAVVVGPGHLRKTGSGQLWLNASNTYTGLNFVLEGAVVAHNVGALGDFGNGTIVYDGASLIIDAPNSLIREQISLEGAGDGAHGALNIFGAVTLRNQFPSIYACVDLTTNASIRIEPGGQLTMDGFVSGAGSLTKVGAGTLVFINPNANLYSGDTIIQEGTLELRKPNGNLSIPGNLVLGPSASSPALARFFQTGGIGPNASVTVNGNALFDLNGNSHQITQLILNDGGGVQTAAGRLNFTGGGGVQVGSLSPSGSHFTSIISGGIGLPPNAFVTFNVAPFAISPPFPLGPELLVPAIISVNGAESVSFEPAGLNKIGLGRMQLTANNAYRGEAFIGGGVLQVDGLQPQSKARISIGGRLEGSGTLGHVNYQGSGGTLAPGNGAGTLTISNLNAGASGNGVLYVELNGTTPGTSYDQLNVRGTVTLTGMTLGGSLGFPSTIGNQFTIINNDGTDAVIGTFAGVPQNGSVFVGGEKFFVNYSGGSGNDVVLTRVSTPPPPVLTLERAAPGAIRLLWPTNDPAYRLQFTANLTLSNWASVTSTRYVVGTNFIVTNAASGPNPSALTNIAWYRLGEADPGAFGGGLVQSTTRDSAGSNHLQRLGFPSYTDFVAIDAATHVGSTLGVQFSGSNQSFSNRVVTTAMENFGVEFWIRPNGGSGARLLYNGEPNFNGWGLFWDSGNLSAYVAGSGTFGFAFVPFGQWSHVALVRDFGMWTIYVNGIMNGSSFYFLNPPAKSFLLGPSPDAGDFFTGEMDEVRVFTFQPGQFSTSELMLNQMPVTDTKYYRLVNP